MPGRCPSRASVLLTRPTRTAPGSPSPRLPHVPHIRGAREGVYRWLKKATYKGSWPSIFGRNPRERRWAQGPKGERKRQARLMGGKAARDVGRVGKKHAQGQTRRKPGHRKALAAALDPTAYCETPVYNPDLCPNMIAAQAKLVYHLNKYYNEKCQARKAAIAKTIREVCKVVSDVLKEVEVQEPRFISSLNEMDNRYEGLEVISPTEFEVVLYLNQMGVFNFVDDGSLPGCAVLKLSDGRKRSMSLWVEFITASGYLSARKIRSRFQTLVAQAVDKCSYRDVVKMVADTSEVKLRIRDRYVVQITPAFKCTGIWPRSAAHWPLPHIPWPGPNRVAEVKAEGFNLLSKECHSLAGKQSSAESDAWVLQFAEAENRLQMGGCRKKCLSILKTLRDRHLELPGQPLNNYHMKTLVSYECEKHPRESDWDESCLGDRLNGILLQLISCLQCRRCPHYFLPNLDLFQGKPHSALENAAKQTWRLAREILTNPKSLEKL
ncbi:Protein mab-21-like 1 [Sciurus carolinensis]|uniref:Putative nucleotidyltransferase MAB21L1 n=1 Tax=Sciurus carolinensis TaxID=30640 RepID=A0AA41MMF2_SCICA|nr:Protein mab-21-like 1 [Sciurus carolinensis]